MDPMNKQARDSLTRCLKCIKEDTGKDYVPEGEDIVINKTLPDAPAPTMQPQVSKNEPKVEEIKTANAQSNPEPTPEATSAKLEVNFEKLFE